MAGSTSVGELGRAGSHWVRAETKGAVREGLVPQGRLGEPEVDGKEKRGSV